MAETPKSPDWAEIEKDYRRSKESVKEIARWHQVSDTAIHKRAKADGWVREVKPVRLSLKAEPVVPAAVAAADVDPTDIADRGRGLVLRLLNELDAVTTHGTELEEMIEAAEDDPRRRTALLKAISLSERAGVVRSLATAFKTWAEAQAPAGKKAERQAKADAAAAGGGKFAPRPGPRLVSNNG